jgi:hypothetical protein
MILLIGRPNASAQAQNGSDKITIDRATAEAAEQAFEEVQAARQLIKDLRAENAALNTNLNLANRLAESESKRADAEARNATAERGRADALQVALDASKKETAAQTEIARIRTDEVKDVRAQLKKEKRGRLAERILFVVSHVLRSAF